MKRKRHTEEQSIAILKEHEAGMKTADLCRKHGISEASFYNWKAKYGGLEVSEAQRLKGLGRRNARLKKLLTDAMHVKMSLRESSAMPWGAMNWPSPSRRSAQCRKRPTRSISAS